MADENQGQNHFDGEVGADAELERALRLLKPTPSRIDRDRFFFLAGRASAEAVRPGSTVRRWAWPAATFVSSVTAVVLSVLLVTRTQPGASRADLMAAKSDHPSLARRDADGAKQNVAAIPSRADIATPNQIGTEEPSPEIGSATLPPTTAELNYPRLRSLVLAYGVNAFPKPTPTNWAASSSEANHEPRTQRELLQQLLNTDRS